ncbi:MAG: Ltp family lipoprotein [Clostridia bacterium]
MGYVTSKDEKIIVENKKEIKKAEEEIKEKERLKKEEKERVEKERLEQEKRQKIQNASIGEKNALNKAKSYLNYTAFSYSGLVKQLEFEGFSNSEARFGVIIVEQIGKSRQQKKQNNIWIIHLFQEKA